MQFNNRLTAVKQERPEFFAFFANYDNDENSLSKNDSAQFRGLSGTVPSLVSGFTVHISLPSTHVSAQELPTTIELSNLNVTTNTCVEFLEPPTPSVVERKWVDVRGIPKRATR